MEVSVRKKVPTPTPTTVEELLKQHPTNFVVETGSTTTTKKDWTENYSPIQYLKVHTKVMPGGMVWADFDGTEQFDGPFFEEFADDQLRRSMEAYPPNTRVWHLESESDISDYFLAEIAGPVLAGWSRYPCIVQTSEARPLHDIKISEKADHLYSLPFANTRLPQTIGEMKRNLIKPEQWQAGALLISPDQLRLSCELRGYACLYECPQVFCFDGKTLLILQFRAPHSKDMSKTACPVDCWVIPRENVGGTPLRYAFYRLLSQGFRRIQSMSAVNPAVHGAPPDDRWYFNGKPIWRNPIYDPEKAGYSRVIDARNGAFYWEYQGNEFAGPGGAKLWDTGTFW